jgi:hypothetical protein
LRLSNKSINRTLMYIKTMTVNQHKSKIHDTSRVNTNKILKIVTLDAKLATKPLIIHKSATLLPNLLHITFRL